MTLIGRRVLVVDDDQPFRSLLAAILRSWGHDVVAEAGTVEEALAQARAIRPDTAIVDIGLPDGDGFALTRLLRSLPEQPRVILVSSDCDEADEPACRASGASGLFRKDDLAGLPFRETVAG
jgi:CheY-like chemotaxis protein